MAHLAVWTLPWPLSQFFLVATLSETDAELTAVRLRAEEQAPLPLQAGA